MVTIDGDDDDDRSRSVLLNQLNADTGLSSCLKLACLFNCFCSALLSIRKWTRFLLDP